MEPRLSCERGAVLVGVPAMKGTGGGRIFEYNILQFLFVNLQHAYLAFALKLWALKLDHCFGIASNITGVTIYWNSRRTHPATYHTVLYLDMYVHF